MQQIISHIAAHHHLQAKEIVAVSGGDINLAFCFSANEKKYFIKINTSGHFPDLMEKEAQGLNELQKNNLIHIPKIIAHGTENGMPYLILEWLERGIQNETYWYRFGEALAHQHLIHAENFGYQNNNYLATLKQDNTPHKSWGDFYFNCRIMPLAKILFHQKKIAKQEFLLFEKLEKNLSSVFPKEKPALLHGDLWSGNIMALQNSVPTLIDPAVYYGHREMDIGMTLLFGGFSKTFYDSYNSFYPLAPGWEKRTEICQLYPLMTHAVLFGGGYVQNSLDIAMRFN